MIVGVMMISGGVCDILMMMVSFQVGGLAVLMILPYWDEVYV